MNKYKLNKWKYIEDHWVHDPQNPRVELANDSSYATLRCEISKTGLVSLATGSGGGHGEPNIEDSGRTCEEWFELFKEIKDVQRYYYGKETAKSKSSGSS